MKLLTTTIRIFTALAFLIISNNVLAQPANDEPCNATVLPVNTTCVYTSGTNVAATNTVGVPAPGCASYSGQDVWYSITVPASGSITFDSNTGSMTDGGMAIYSGACNSLSLLACNDDSSPNGAMPLISLSGQTPGATLYIRFWDYGGGTGTFSICVRENVAAPPCGSSPAAGNSCAIATPICNLDGYCGNTSATYTSNTWTQLSTVFCGSLENNSFLSFVASSNQISFNVWVNSSTLGYGIQILIFSAANCSGAVTQYGPCYNPGTVQPGPVNITATGLTVGNTYYIMIDGNAGDVCNYTIGADSGILTPVTVDPLAMTICDGDNVPLLAAGGNGSFTWDASPDLSTTSGPSTVATPTGGEGVYNYTVNSSTGNPLCPSSTSATAVITVEPCGCNVVAGNSGPICSGETVDLTASNMTGATYSWTGPGGWTSLDQNPTDVPIPTTPGTYDFTVNAVYNGEPCSSITTVTVNPNPVVDAGTYNVLCANDADLVIAGSPAGGIFTGSGVTGTNFDPSVGTQTLVYDFTDGNGCSGTDNVVITVNPNPIVDAGIYGPICNNLADINLAGTPVGGTFTGTGVTGNVFDLSAGTQTINYSFTDGNGCSNDQNTTITVYTAPIANPGNYPPVCEEVGGFPIVGSPAGGIFSGIGVTGGSFSTAFGTQPITYTYTDMNGCVDDSTIQLIVYDDPAIFAGTDIVICLGDPVILSGSGGVNYVWDNGVSNNVSFTPNLGTQIYTVTGTDVNGCTNTDNVSVTVLEIPVAQVNSDIQTGEVALSVEFYNNSLYSTSYVWNYGDGNSQIANNNNNQNHTFNIVGEYDVILIASNGICEDVDTIHIIVLPVPDPEVKVPNVFSPNGDGINDVFYLESINVVQLNVIIVNRWGNLVAEINDPNLGWDGTINGKPAEDGVYFFKYTLVGVSGLELSGHGNVTLVR